jgi:carbamoyltransferase
MLILGINAYHGDASAAIVRDGQLLAAIEEERLNRQKHCAGFPELAVRYCLEVAGATLADVDHVAVSRDPSLRLMDKILFAIKAGPKILPKVKERFSAVAKVKSIEEELCSRLGVAESAVKFKVHNVEHHRAHVASAFFVSPFEEAACASIDGFGDFVSTMRAAGSGNQIEVVDRVEFPHSIGAFYTTVTQFIGFPKYGDEGKVMGLAPYGEPRYVAEMERVVQPTDDKLFKLDRKYFRHASEAVDMSWKEGSPSVGRMFTDQWAELFGPPREPGSEITQRDMDIAASLQKHCEHLILTVLNGLHERVPSDNLCLAGGVALNCVANGMIRDNTPFKELFVQAAAGDGGTAIGAAFHVWNQKLEQPRGFVMENAYLGPEYGPEEIDAALEGREKLKVEVLEGTELYDRTAAAIADGLVVGWFQGRVEFGPRALGNRSIVADPRRPDMKDILNSRIKHREPFRPFAPSVQVEHAAEYFEQDYPSPFMNLCYAFAEEWREKLPAVDHVDHTGRLQTVSREQNERYWELIEAFRRQTGVALVLNTSFNENEPIVCTPAEALHCFTTTQMDVLVMGDRFVTKQD